LSKLFRNLLNENEKSDETNIENCHPLKELNCIISEIECIKKAQTVMSNKLDLIIEKLNSESPSSNNNSITSSSVSVKLTGAKKRKFNNSNNKSNSILNDCENVNNNNNNNTNNNIDERDDFDVINAQSFRQQNRLENFSNNSNQEIEEIEIKTDKNDIYNKNTNENSLKCNTQMISNNNSNKNMPSMATQQQSQSQFFEIDVTELLNEPHISRNLNLENYNDFKPPIYKMNDTFYVDDSLSMAAYSKSKSRRNFAAHLTKLVFTPRERLESNCNGRNGKNKLDINRLQIIRNTIFKYYPCKQSTLVLDGDTISSGDNDENTVWYRDCIPAIDESNRVLKKQVIAWHKKYLCNVYSTMNQSLINQSYNNVNNSSMNGASASIALVNSSIIPNSFNNNNDNNNLNSNYNNLNYLSDENSNNNNNNYQYDCEDGFDDIYD
jgi:hypothetical protein